MTIVACAVMDVFVVILHAYPNSSPPRVAGRIRGRIRVRVVHRQQACLALFFLSFVAIFTHFFFGETNSPSLAFFGFNSLIPFFFLFSFPQRGKLFFSLGFNLLNSSKSSARRKTL